MSGEQQLERSVLERKERDELHAIAAAMAIKPGVRTKKADIIDQILMATGIVPAKTGADGGSAPGEQGPTGTYGHDTPGEQSLDSKVPSADGERASAVAGEEVPKKRRTRRRIAAEPEGEASPAEGAGAAEVLAHANGSAPAQPAHEAGQPTERARLAPEPQPAQGAQEASEGEAAQQAPAAYGEQAGQAPQVVLPPAPGPATDGGAGQGAIEARPAEPRYPEQPVLVRTPAALQQGVPEQGSRRSRRRRGRDRDRAERVDREPQGGPEVPFQGEPTPVAGLLELRDEGFGFLRTSGYLPGPRDVYVSQSQVRRFGLRKGDYIEGASRPAVGNDKYPALLRIDTVSDMTPDEARARPRFEDLTPLFPDSRLRLEIPGDTSNMTARIVDLLSPIGKGQRGLIVSPPKAGKTTVLKEITHSIELNNPEVHLMVLLVDERPEEVTDMRHHVKRAEVVFSTFDRPSDEHTAVAELAIERAKRLVEKGRDVVIILDGITRLARAYNLAQPATGRIMSGGVDSGALYPPKKFFGAARNIEEGGSLTILATALVETGSRMDEVIFEEFKGTGNMELRLDRRLAERRIYPAIDVNASSTRHEELLFTRSQLQQVWKLRRVLNGLASDGSSAAGLELLMDRIKTTRSNDEFLEVIAKGPSPTA